MQTVTTRRGKTIEVISQSELCNPLTSGAYVRAYCHIHGSDHQRSLSIQRETGWGHCFNAACQAVVLVEEWNPEAASHLLSGHSDDILPARKRRGFASTAPKTRLPLALQPMLLYPPAQNQPWQQDELEQLQTLASLQRKALLRSRRAQAYLHERKIPLTVARETGIGYLPAEVLPRLRSYEERTLLRRWTSRIIFPLVSPYGEGYIGRTLWQWEPGMNEIEHKHLLEETDGPRRWIKTNPAGWFSCPLEQLASTIILVEGAFDRLALLAAGCAPQEVVALTGTAAMAAWFPPQIKHIVLALDGDEGGYEATERLAEQLGQEGYQISLCPPPQDGMGKDWNERWRRAGIQGLRPLLATRATLRSA